MSLSWFVKLLCRMKACAPKPAFFIAPASFATSGKTGCVTTVTAQNRLCGGTVKNKGAVTNDDPAATARGRGRT